MSTEKLKRIYTRRSLIEKKLDSSQVFVEQFEGNNVNEIKNRIDEMKKIRDDFEKLTIDIITHSINDDESDPDNQTEILSKFEKRWFTVLSELQLLLETKESQLNQQNMSKHESSQSQINVRLPTINLPEFNGAYKDWLPFYDAFNSLIHENNSLDNCQKFHYLKSCLKGEAMRAIESLTISNKNYESAWSILQKRYKNTRLIIQSHVQAILNTNEVTKCTSITLRKLIDDVTTNLQALKVLEIPVDSWDAMLVTLIMSKLDYQTRREFENTLDSTTPTLEQLIDFLEKKCTVIESISQHSNNAKPIGGSDFSKTPVQYNRASHAMSAKFVCYFCKGRHFISQCQKFLSLSIPDRINEAKNRKWCLNCLRNNHAINNCKATGCSICKSCLHHTLLHEEQAETKIATTRTVTQSAIPQASANYCRSSKHVVLSTAFIKVLDFFGNYQQCRSLLDVGSQLNLISKATCERLNLKTKRNKMLV